MAHRLDVLRAAREARKSKLHLPQAWDGKSIRTMNQTGSMFSSIADFDRKFINMAVTSPPIRVLEIGCAYGHICLEALKNACQHYTAVDKEENHLKARLIS